VRALLLNQFYPPDVAPTGRLLHDLARNLASRRHDVEVVCSRRRYGGGGWLPSRGVLDGVAVRRIPTTGFGRSSTPGRGLDYLSYLLGVAAVVRRRRDVDLVLALTTPPLLGLVASRATAGDGPAIAHWTMDLYPDALAAEGSLSAGGAAYRFLQRLVRAQYRGARLVLGLGHVMERRLGRYLEPDTPRASVWPWGSPPAAPDVSAQLRARRGWGAEELVLMYSGNVGRAHRVSEFLQAATALGPEGPVWAFVGGGARRAELENAGPGARIARLPYVDEPELAASLGSADVHLASLSSGWEGVVVPSKVPAAMAAGRPVIYVGPESSEAAEWVRRSGGGWCVGEGKVGDLIAAVYAARDRTERERRAAAARAFAAEHFDRQRNCDAIAAQLEACASG
jgi:putative colanic acid biosynthesis glycosyltransferase WcaI